MIQTPLEIKSEARSTINYVQEMWVFGSLVEADIVCSIL
jgi:hypothetical protein